MRRVLLIVGLVVLAAGTAGEAVAQGTRHAPPGSSGHGGELECRNCHQGKHQGVVRMYLGLGGRGAPVIPSHMVQVRVQCVACHILPKEEAATAAIVGQTFRPTEQACVNCHGERYRGMLARWVETLSKMRGIVALKLRAARAALGSADPKDPKHRRAEELVKDAEFNIQFVERGKGAHNVFYAADLLKVSNAWLGEASALLGKAAAMGDDRLVRGGYCGVLCHEQAGVKLPDTVTFGKQKVPHARHVSEFGALCTTCHSAETHKAVTATPATCSSCHHGPQNERCESCHRAQSVFYRGQVQAAGVKLEPNVMVNAVACTGCHDLSKKHSPRTVEGKCVECHDASYTSFAAEWTAGLAKEIARAADEIKRADLALARVRRAGRRAPEAEALVAEARQALDIVRRARGAHNPPGAESLLEVSRKKAGSALAALTGR